MALQIHVYQPSDTDSFEDFSNSSGVRDDDDTTAASVNDLPNRSWNGLWDSLIYADDIKMKLLDYIHATLVLSDANVDCEAFSRLTVCVLTSGRKNSQSRFMESCGPFAWSTWHRQNFALSCTCSKALYTSLTSVKRGPTAFLIKTYIKFEDIPTRVCLRSIPILCFQNGFPNLANWSSGSSTVSLI
jgi:hypothetical protein